MFGKLKKKKIEETGFFTYLLLTQDLNKIKKYILCTLLQILLGLEPVKEFNFSDERRGFPESIIMVEDGKRNIYQFCVFATSTFN